MGPQMEMSQIKYVLSAAKHLNFTKAANECNVSQPALTKGVKALETDLGAAVFHREGRKILLSDFELMLSGNPEYCLALLQKPISIVACNMA